ncbi:MAG TPA: M14 family zinc carboxypeptidase [Actinomycetota bacterium]|nr:M14 family zinc carboxypeptidase [Actinomycetota bacterium]
MRNPRKTILTILAASVLIGAVVTPTVAQQGAGGGGRLQLFEATVNADQWAEIQGLGLDIAHVEETPDGIEFQVVMYPRDRKSLQQKGIKLRPVRNEDGQTQIQAAAAQSVHGFDVWRSYDEPGGIEDQIRAIASAPQNRGFTKLYKLGESHQGRDILAIRLTQGAQGLPLGKRPAVLYQATTHAREWIGTEVDMRLLKWYVAERRAGNPEVQSMLETTELWFVPVVNPDGYQYTFDGDRLWRKNLRDNNGDGEIAPGDGVDLNRNYAEHWNYDEEGSSSQFASETYRGPAPESEPETQANVRLFDMLSKLRFVISYHSFGNLLLYPQGWQVQTPSADDPIYVALTGTDDDPAVEGYDPGVGADLYTTNGEFTDWAHGDRGVLAWTPELDEGCPGCGFVFPDDEALVQAEFERNLEFALNVARSAVDPDDPASHMGLETEDFYLDVSDIDPQKTNNPSSDLAVDISYGGGSSQPVEVLAKRAVGAVTLRYRINGGATQTASTSEAADGEVFGGNNAYNTYYHYLRGEIPGISVGDSVEYWFTAGSSSSDHQTFEVVEDADADVLILAHEDRTGAVNIPGYASTDPNVPNYLSSYTDALDASGVSYDVWDVDAMGRQAPDHLGVLSHYNAVIWYMGNNFVTRQLGRGPGNIARLANDLILEARAYLNEGGKLLYTGQWAGAAENGLAGGQYYDPVADEACVVGGAASPIFGRCAFFADKNDFLQYYLGAYIYNSDAGTDDDGDPFDVLGVSDPYTGMGWEFNGADSAENQVHTASFITTSSLLPEEEYPQFASTAPAVWDTGAAGAFEPFDGDWYVYSNMGDISFKRLMRTIDLTGVAPTDPIPTLTFRFSYDTEPAWDFVFVEAHTVGEDDWTTLPEATGHTGNSTGDSCPSGWFELHPWLERYQGADCSGSNPATGGEWNATSGRSGGWEEWEIDLSDYAGSQVEVSISYASDWAVQGLGAWVDHVEVSTEPGVESFESGLGAWTVAGPPEGSAANPNDWERTQSVGFEEGAVAATDDTLYFGFGFEGITGAPSRAAVMEKSMGYLLGP